MLNILSIKLKKKSRKYRIKRDEYGRSARQRAFEAFGYGKRPAEVASIVGISLRTACRFFADWKKLPGDSELWYRIAKAGLKNQPGLPEEVIKTFAAKLDISEEEVRGRLQKPWAVKQLVTGKWAAEVREKEEEKRQARLEAATELIYLYEVVGVPLDRIIAELGRLRAEVRAERETITK
jgi:hypothetical protein